MFGTTNGPGTFSWTSNRNAGEFSANSYFPSSEGIKTHKETGLAFAIVKV